MNDVPQAMSLFPKPAMGLVEDAPFMFIRTHVPSPWSFPSTYNVVKVVWPLAVAARVPRTPMSRECEFLMMIDELEKSCMKRVKGKAKT